MNIRLDGKKALVCGATQGIGRAIAESLDRAGAHVTALGRNADSLTNLRAEIGCDVMLCDMGDLEDVLSKEPEIASGNFDILINNSGGPAPGLLHQDDWQKLQAALMQHVASAHHLTQWAVPGMKQGNYGRIINVISSSVKIPIIGLGVSNTVRGAMASWSKTLAGELASDGITVNSILPGYIDTGRLRSIIETRAKSANVSLDDMASRMKAEVPAGRLGLPEELASLAVFLCSDQAAYINGTAIPVDGGKTGTI